MAGDVSDRRSSPAPHDDLEHSSKLTHANNDCTNGTAASDKTTVLSTAAPGGHDEAIDLEARPLPSKRPTELFDQSSRNSPKRILTVMACLQMLLFISFVDQSSVAAILPVLAQDLNAADSINWTGTAFLVSTASTTMIIARLSDIFGRKAALVAVVIIFAVANLICGFAKNAVMLYIFRAFSGIGAGGINGLSMIIVSDIVSIRERGKYQGMIGGVIALGGGVGPLIGAAFAQRNWRFAFWFPTIWCAVALGPLCYFLRLPVVRGRVGKKLRQIDWYGSLLSLAGSIFILVPLSSGGTVYRWDSATVIVLFVLGGLFSLAFIYVEKRHARYPIMPLHLLTNRTVVLVLLDTMAFGWIYICQLFFYPSYYQAVLGYSVIKSSVFLLPLVLLQPVFSIACGQITSRTGYVVPQILFGYCILSIGTGLTTRFDVDSTEKYIIPILCVNAVGIGCTIQTTLVVAQNAVEKQSRAVVTGLRNYSRFVAGAVALALCGTIRNLVLRDQIDRFSSQLPSDQVETLLRTGRLPEGSAVGDALRRELARANMTAFRAVFWTFVPLALLSVVFTIFIPNDKIGKEEVKPAVEAKKEESISPDPP